MESEDVRRRELAPLMKSNDDREKLVLPLDSAPALQRTSPPGTLIDWLLNVE